MAAPARCHAGPRYLARAMSATWLSAHLFWTGPLDELLRGCVAPVVAYASRQRLVTRFFFIRYAEGGPHIRLRLSIASAEAQQELTAYLLAQVADFQSSMPPKLAEAAPVRVSFLPYEPETARYGGPAGLPLAEAFFEASSRAVLRWLGIPEVVPDASRLLTAVLLHTLFVGACLPPALTTEWLGRYTDDWLPHDPQAGLPQPAEQAAWRALFAEHYQRQRAALCELVQPYWPATAPAQPLLPRWLASFRVAACHASKSYQRAVPDPARRQAIYASLLHMTNNRLGVPNHDEAFVAYLLGAAIQDLTP
jgi:thiopeptide-type bacteriocin biosynthesis protein